MLTAHNVRRTWSLLVRHLVRVNVCLGIAQWKTGLAVKVCRLFNILISLIFSSISSSLSLSYLSHFQYSWGRYNMVSINIVLCTDKQGQTLRQGWAASNVLLVIVRILTTRFNYIDKHFFLPSARVSIYQSAGPWCRDYLWVHAWQCCHILVFAWVPATGDCKQSVSQQWHMESWHATVCW